MLHAVRLIANEMPNFSLRIVGDGEERQTLERLRVDLNLHKHVEFLGARGDVSRLLEESGIFVLSSLGEGLSLTLLEAMASGLPIVATRVGGNPEVVVDGVTGLLVPPSSPSHLAAAVMQMIRHPLQTLEMGRQGRCRVEREFDMGQVARRYESLYLQLLGQTNGETHSAP